jgi:hypothetical protein
MVMAYFKELPGHIPLTQDNWYLVQKNILICFQLQNHTLYLPDMEQALLQKLTLIQHVIKFLAFHGVQKSIPFLIRASYWTLS